MRQWISLGMFTGGTDGNMMITHVNLVIRGCEEV